MDNAERDAIIGKLLAEGKSLAEVQRVLEEEHDVKITYMDLRLIASDIEVDWSKVEPEPAEDHSVSEIEPEDLEVEATGSTTVNLSRVQRPGAVLSGDVTFKSGAKADWYVDQMGRLGLQPAEGSGQPTEEDLQEFQEELQRVVQGGGR